jgi:phosphatidylglycerophosphate synthase
MNTYDITDRRPIKHVFRMMAFWVTDRCVSWGVRANTISLLSIVSATIAGALLWLSPHEPWLLFVAPWFAMLRLYFNMLDGMVAIKAGEAGPTGEVFNELPDRLSDVIIFASVAHTAYANTTLTYWVIVGMLLVAYIGILGKTVGARRQFGGLMPKPVRMYLLVVACLLQLAIAPSPATPVVALGMTAFDLISILILAGLAETATRRTLQIFRNLSSQDTQTP